MEVDLLSSLLAALVNQASAYTAGATTPQRMGNRHPSIAPYELLTCADGELVLAVGNDRQFAALCTVLSAPFLSDDPRFADNSARVTNREALIAELEERLRTRPAQRWAQDLIAARVPAGVVNDIPAAFALAESLGLQPIVGLPDEDGVEVRLTRNPIALSATPSVYRSAPPPLGAAVGGDWSATAPPAPDPMRTAKSTP